jgi:hypothetical protein
VNPVPQVDLGRDTCGTESITLDAGGGMTTYEWIGGSTGQTYTADTTGTYWVEVNDGGPCNGSDTITTYVLDIPVVNDTARCGPGTSALFVSDTSQSYKWYDSGEAGNLLTTGDTVNFNVDSSSTYYVASYYPNLTGVGSQSGDTSHYALNFDGNDDYVAIEDYHYEGSNYSEVTVEAWIRTSDGGNQYIASYDRSEYWRLEINGEAGGIGTSNWEIYTDNGQLDFGGNTRIDDGNWHHVAGVYNNGEVIIYVDGVKDASTTYGSTFGTGVTRYGLLGRNSEAETFDGDNYSSTPLNGDMTEFRVWSEARSQSEIQDYMHQSLTGGEENLEIYYQMDDGTGSDTLTDNAGTNNGQMRNMDPAGDWNNIGPGIESYFYESTREKVNITVNPLPEGTINPLPSVDSICEGEETELQVVFNEGSTPFDFYYSDGTTADTIYDITQDTTIIPAMQPQWTDGVSDTTYYYIEEMVDSLNCRDTAIDTTHVEIFKRPDTGNQYYVPNEFDQ